MEGSRTHARHIVEQIVYPSDGLGIVGWIMRPRTRGPHPVIVYNHGSRLSAGGGAHRLSTPTLSLATPAWPGVEAGNCALFFPEGRGYAGSEGPRLTDCRTGEAVVDFLKERARDAWAGVEAITRHTWADGERIAMTGCSHGAVVSLFAGTDPRCGAVVAQAPGASIEAPLLGVAEMISAMRAIACSVLVQHAANDDLCPVDISRTLHRAGCTPGRRVRLVEYPARQHVSGHAQFDFANRDVWSEDFDAGLTPVTRGGRVVSTPAV